MAERPIAAVLKTVEPARVPGVQIPLSPLFLARNLLKNGKLRILYILTSKKLDFVNI